MPKFPRFFVPIIACNNPPAGDTALCKAANIFPISATACNFSASAGFKVDTVSRSKLIASPNVCSCSPNDFIGDSPKLMNFPIQSRIPAPVSFSIISPIFATPSNAESSMFFVPSINGFKFSMKLDRLFPISGKPEVAPAENPPAMLPIKEPSPYPIFSSILIPPSRNSSAPGIKSINPATATNSAPATVTTAINLAAPATAFPPTFPAAPRIRHAVDKASINPDNASAFANVD